MSSFSWSYDFLSFLHLHLPLKPPRSPPNPRPPLPRNPLALPPPWADNAVSVVATVVSVLSTVCFFLFGCDAKKATSAAVAISSTLFHLRCFSGNSSFSSTILAMSNGRVRSSPGGWVSHESRAVRRLWGSVDNIRSSIFAWVSRLPKLFSSSSIIFIVLICAVTLLSFFNWNKYYFSLKEIVKISFPNRIHYVLEKFCCQLSSINRSDLIMLLIQPCPHVCSRKWSSNWYLIGWLKMTVDDTRCLSNEHLFRSMNLWHLDLLLHLRHFFICRNTYSFNLYTYITSFSYLYINLHQYYNSLPFWCRIIYVCWLSTDDMVHSTLFFLIKKSLSPLCGYSYNRIKNNQFIISLWT